MACGKCNYEPRLIAWPHIIKANHPAEHVPWYGVSGTIDGSPVADFEIPAGECAVSLRVQAVNLLPGDTIAWEYSADGATWYAIEAGPIDWGIADGASYIDYFESTEGDIRLPLDDGSVHWWRITVSRPDCSDMEYAAKFVLEDAGTASSDYLSTAWKTVIEDPVEYDIRTNGVASISVNAAFYTYAQQTGYELCVGEETLIPDAIETETVDLVLDCAETGDVVKLDNAGLLDAGEHLVTNHLDTMTVGAVLGTIYHDQYGSQTYYIVGAEQGIDVLTFWYFDLYGRLFSKKLRIVVQCDTDISESCGDCSINANWKASLAPYFYQEDLYSTQPPPWADTGATIDATPAADFVPGDGKVSAMLVLQALNILPGDVLQWQYSLDGLDWYGLEDNGGGIDWGLSEDTPTVATALSTETAIRLPLINNQEFYLALNVERENCTEMYVQRKLTVTMTDPVGTSSAGIITLKADNVTVSVANGRLRTLVNTATSDVTGLETYVDCEGGCDPTVTDGGGGSDSTGNEDLDELFEEVSGCMEELAANLWLDVGELPCGT